MIAPCFNSVGRRFCDQRVMAGVAIGGILSEEFSTSSVRIRMPIVVEGRCAFLAHVLLIIRFLIYGFPLHVQCTDATLTHTNAQKQTHDCECDVCTDCRNRHGAVGIEQHADSHIHSLCSLMCSIKCHAMHSNIFQSGYPYALLASGSSR